MQSLIRRWRARRLIRVSLLLTRMINDRKRIKRKPYHWELTCPTNMVVIRQKGFNIDGSCYHVFLSTMEKGIIAQQPRGKSRHSAAAWKKETQHSSVEREDMAQQRGKSRHCVAWWKE